MPDDMLRMARRSGLEHWAARKDVAATDSSLVEKDPGIIRTSNCGEFAKEFCCIVRSCAVPTRC